MKRTVPRLDGPARRLAKGELIGLGVRIAAAHDAGIVGLHGDIVDETLHTLAIRIDGPGGRRVQVGKVGTTFAFPAPDGEVLIDGAAMEYRSEDRTKKIR